jgi:hypothetical protein
LAVERINGLFKHGGLPVSKEFVCTSQCFGFMGRRWKLGQSVVIKDNELESLDGHFHKHFVEKERFVMPDTSLAGGPRVEGVLKAPIKITDTAMSPTTREMLGLKKQNQEYQEEPRKIDEVLNARTEVESEEKESIQQPVKRGRRLGSKNVK